jgi:GTP cyclohydrolase I
MTMKHTNPKHSLGESLRGLGLASHDDFLAEVAAVKEAIASYATDAEFDPSVHVSISASEEANFADTPIRAAKAVIQLQASRHSARDKTDVRVLSDRKTLINGIKAKYHYFNEVRKIIETGFPTEGGDCGIVTQGPILAKGLCPHHFLPVYYEVFVAYKPTPDGNVLGLSKLARVTKELAARPVLQEQLTADIASVLCKQSDTQGLPGIASDGSAVQMVGNHTCMGCRGIRSDALTLTTVLRGEFSKNPELKSEFYQAIFAIRQTKI